MIRRAGLAAALVVAWAAAALWAYGTTVLQPAAESALHLALRSPGGDMPHTSSYWARDLRWAAIPVLMGLLVALSRGDRWRSTFALGGAVAWVGVDVALDRANPGPSALVPSALLACLVVTVAAVAAHVRPGVPCRGLLTTAGAACATTAMTVASLESPTGADGALGPSRLVLLALLIVVAVSCALAAAPAPAADRAPAALAVVGGSFALAAAGDHPVPQVLGVVVLVAGVWLLSRSWPGLRHAAAGIAGLAVACPVLAFISTLVTIDAGRTFTALAGNPQISPADADMLMTLTGALIGVVLGAARVAQHWLAAELRPDPPAARWLSH